MRTYRGLRRLVVLGVLVLVVGLVLVVSAGVASAQTVVSLTFDNDASSQFSLGYQQALQPSGVNATFYVNSGTMGSSNKLSWSQLSTLSAAGNDVGGKTVDGINLTTLSASQQVSEICNDRQSIVQHGITPSSFAYPSGASNAAIQSEVQGCGYGNARTAGSLTTTGPSFAESLPPRSWLALRAYAPAGQVTLANLEAIVTGAAAHGGGWIPVVIQKVCSQTLDAANYASCTTASGWVDLGDLNTFLSWVNNAGQPGGAPAGTVFKTVASAVSGADSSAPTTTISCNGSPCQSSTYAGTVFVSLAATDLGSGVASTHYTTDGSTPTLSSPTYTGQFPLTASTTVQYRSWDTAGNAEAPHSQAISLQESPDSTPPSTTISCNGGPCQSTYYQPVTVSLNASDNSGGWGVDKTYYTTDGSTPTTSSPVYTGPFTVNGTSTISFFSTDLAGNAEQVNVQRLQVPTIVSLTFDDQYIGQWQYAVPVLRADGFNATFYVITDDTDHGYSCCMSWAQLNTLQSQGDDIGSHTIDHTPDDMRTLTTAQFTQEVCGSRQDLVNHGISNPVSFAYPDGLYNASMETVVQQCGFTNARAGGGISNSNFTPTAPFIETIPPKDPLAVRTIAVDGANPENLADLQSFVTAAAAHGGGWLPITFHNVCDRAQPDWNACIAQYGSIEDTVLTQFLNWLAAAGQPGGAPASVTVKTMRDTINLTNH